MVGALDLGRANAAPGSYVDVPPLRAGSPGRGQVTVQSWQARRSSVRADHARALLLVAALARPASSSASAADAVACWLPTLGGCVAALARPGEGKNQGAPSGRRLPPEGGLAWS
jgi:hypothetical protein